MQSRSNGNPSVAEQRQRAAQFVAERLRVWQQRLNLEEWQVAAVMTRRSELKPKTLGGIRWDKAKKSAVIWVLDPSDYRVPLQAMLDDMELTIVHELIHLELAALRRGEARRSQEEHAVNRIAEALVRLDRENQLLPPPKGEKSSAQARGNLTPQRCQASRCP